jgi:arylsulfatase A-like enzyme
MISRMDEGVGRVLARLRDLGLDENTLVLFSSDNGPHREGGPGYDPAFFNASGGLRGIKRDLTEGGIRVPLIARWPGRVPAGVSTARPAYQGDLFATFAELAGAPAPTALDSISLVPSLHGRLGDQREHEFLYWEFYERTYRQAVIWQGRWKGIRTARDQATFELYDLANDPAETRNVASSEVAVVTTLASQMDTAHRPTPHWSFPSPSVEPKSVVPTSRAP